MVMKDAMLISRHPENEKMKLHPVTLAFTGNQSALESEFAVYYFKKNLSHVRFCHYISLLFYLFSSVIDFAFFPAEIVPFWIIRYGIVVPFFVVGIVITYWPVYQRIWQQLSCWYILITGGSFIAFIMLGSGPDRYTYYIGVSVCMIFGYAYIRERFLWASTAGCALLVLFWVVSASVQLPIKELLVLGFYLFVINSLGMLIAYSYEIESRKDFFLNHLLTLEKQKVDSLATGLEKTVEKRTQALRRSNEELTREVLQRKTMEVALRTSEERYRSLQSNIPIGLYRVADGRLLSVNPTMAKIFRSDSERNLLERPVENFFCDPKELEDVVSQLMTQDSIENVEVRLCRADGSKLTGLVNIIRVASNNKHAFYYDGTLEDITERKKMEAEKETLMTQLRQAYKMEAIGTLAGGIAHDFNNILTSAIGYTELAISEVEKGTRLDKNLHELYGAWKRARDLVQQILTFARKSDDALNPLQVGMVAKEVLKFIRSSLPTTIEIKQNIKSKSNIMGNPIQMYQVFMNLCTNAAHAMEKTGGFLEIKCEDTVIEHDRETPKMGLEPGEYVKVTVSDTGTGISPDIMDSIFEPYFTTKGLGEGTGLGLATVHGIVKNSGGSITVESKLGEGTIFTIFLPVTKQRHADRPPGQGKRFSGTERILFIDDEDPISRLGKQVLSKLGYSVTAHTCSVAAFDDFRSDPNAYDLIVTDMTMPKMTGDSLAKEVRRIRPNFPIILCTGYSKKISTRGVEIKDVSAVLMKPVSNQDLAKTVREVLDAQNE